MRLAILWIVVWTSLACPLFAQKKSHDSPRRDEGTAFSELALAFKRRHGIAPDATPALADVLAEHYAGARIGVVELRYPKSELIERTRVAELAQAVDAALGAHGAWVSWLEVESKEAAQLGADIAKLRKAVDGAKPPAYAKASDVPADLLAALGLSSDLQALGASVAERMVAGTALGLRPTRTTPMGMVFAPTRGEFVELLCYIGTINDHYQGQYWQESIHQWTESFLDDLQLLPLQYPSPTATGDRAQGLALNAREKTGLEEFVAQRVAHSIVWFTFGQDLEAVLESGLAMDVAIAVCGQNNARTGTTSRGTETRAYEMFVPGGMSEGGALPSENGDSRWRKTLGKDHFAEVLRESQKEGVKGVKGDAKRKNGGFELLSDGGGNKHVVIAPFLGAAVVGKETPPAAFLGDYAEFFRCYKACFVEWLRTQGGKGAKQSKAQFAELLRALANDSTATWEGAVQKVYGMPLSATDGGEPSVEWRFLAWLAKGR